MMGPSSTLSHLFTVIVLFVSTLVSIASADSNVKVSYWAFGDSSTMALPAGGLTSLGDPYDTEMIEDINHFAGTGEFLGSGRADFVVALFEAYIDFDVNGNYTLCLGSDDGSRLYFDDVLLVVR